MASILDKYGIKEVANVYFEALADDEKAGVYAGDIVLYLDTLKVSTIETTAESTDATGGWGNAKLVSWDYGKEITVTLTDALISLESLRFMMGGAIKRAKTATPVVVHHTEEVVVKEDNKVPAIKDHLVPTYTHHPIAKFGHPIRLINITKGVRTQIVVEHSTDEDKPLLVDADVEFKNPAMMENMSWDGHVDKGDHIRIFWDEIIENETGSETAIEVTISPSTFPGTYKVVGDTFMRSQDTGKDEPFQFIINKAKVSSEVTITLEAEGDPSTFDMTLNVLRDTNDDGENEMMKLVRYNISTSTSASADNDWGSVTGGSQNT